MLRLDFAVPWQTRYTLKLSVTTAKTAVFKAAWMRKATLGAICAGALVLFFWNIDFPKTPNFDEQHYIPAARALLEGRVVNTEHPPLGKWIIAKGLYLAGDHAVGWQAAVCFCRCGHARCHARSDVRVGFSWIWGVWAMLLTLFNQLLFVQSRIAMLDSLDAPVALRAGCLPRLGISLFSPQKQRLSLLWMGGARRSSCRLVSRIFSLAWMGAACASGFV